MEKKEKFSANIIRYYTNKVHLRGLIKIKIFEPTQVGFVCVAAISNRQEKLRDPFPLEQNDRFQSRKRDYFN